tara:strand:+ start:1052 stop:1795 length:744 start_codon:yes stop_codon:yes gene_type:complete
VKTLIKKILREQEGGVPGVPVETTYINGKQVPMTIPSPPTFFKVVKQVVLSNPGDVLDDEDAPYEDRSWEMDNVLKLFGISVNYEVLVNKIFWAAYDNREGIQDGSINSFDDLELRQYKKYRVECSENWTEHVWYSWAPIVEAYSEDDATNIVYQDEDGYYQYYEWDNQPGFDREVGDSDSDGKEVDGVTEIGIVNESRVIKENESPDENELVDKLRKIMKQWKKEDKENEWYGKIENALKKLHIPL